MGPISNQIYRTSALNELNLPIRLVRKFASFSNLRGFSDRDIRDELPSKSTIHSQKGSRPSVHVEELMQPRTVSTSGPQIQMRFTLICTLKKYQQ